MFVLRGTLSDEVVRELSARFARQGEGPQPINREKCTGKEEDNTHGDTDLNRDVTLQ
jgi:hypothetical protein